ncbi:MAG TPA: peptidylprolyl isomerase [Opitutus sp.]|nr:peptidylprolyl isomerase [Opitutus sp.]
MVVLAVGAALRAQTTLPERTQPITTTAFAPGTAAVAIDLTGHFDVAGVTGQVTQFETVLGTFNVELLATAAPLSVANFLGYVAGGSYANTLIHRSAALGGGSANRIIQGGGYSSAGASITRGTPIALEYNLPNTRGTIAMARASALNSATSEWFFNVDDNSSILDASNNGGYAVFGRVIGTGMSVVDAIAALPTYNVGGPFTNIPLRDIQPNQTQVQDENKILVAKVTAIPLYPATNGASAVLTFSVAASNPAAATASVSGSMLTLTPAGRGTSTVTVHATDTNGNDAEATFEAAVGEAAAPSGGAVVLSATPASGPAPTYAWQRNGVALDGASAATLSLAAMQPADAGLYAPVAAPTPDDYFVVGVATTSKVIGTGEELQPANVRHPNGNIFDQVLLTGAAETITADAGQITRTSFIDPDDDIVQVEFTGPGTLSLTLDNASGPALPLNYNQAVNYMKGRARIVIVGATELTNVSVFTVGRLTAFDPTGGFNFLLPVSATNDPANNGSSLFVGHADTPYGGIADIASIAIASANGKFGGLRASNASLSASAGVTGIFAPNVDFSGPVFVGDIDAKDAAVPMLIIGSTADARITGGDLLQTNGEPLRVKGLTQLKFTAGGDSGGNAITAKQNRGVLEQDGVDVTDLIVVNPP